MPALKSHAVLAHHLGTAPMAEEFDWSFFQDRPLDHGCFSPLSLPWPHQPDWPGRGETLEDFLNTRNAPGALYSAAATPKSE